MIFTSNGDKIIYFTIHFEMIRPYIAYIRQKNKTIIHLQNSTLTVNILGYAEYCLV